MPNTITQLRLLHVEDDATQARLVKALLQRAGEAQFAVTHATRLADAAALLSKQAFDVCLLDLGLPDSAGTGSVSEMRQLCPDMPIVVLTGSDDPWLALAAIKRGAADFMVKDMLHGGTLVRGILMAMERRRAPAAAGLADAIWHQMPVGLAVADAAGQLTHSNAAADKWLAHNAADLQSWIAGENGNAVQVLSLRAADGSLHRVVARSAAIAHNGATVTALTLAELPS